MGDAGFPHRHERAAGAGAADAMSGTAAAAGHARTGGGPSTAAHGGGRGRAPCAPAPMSAVAAFPWQPSSANHNAVTQPCDTAFAGAPESRRRRTTGA